MSKIRIAIWMVLGAVAIALPLFAVEQGFWTSALFFDSNGTEVGEFNLNCSGYSQWGERTDRVVIMQGPCSPSPICDPEAYVWAIIDNTGPFCVTQSFLDSICSPDGPNCNTL